MGKVVTLTIDGTPVTVPEGTLLVEAAKTIATDVPVYCYHPKLGPAGLCRICLVEVEKMPKLQIACNTTVTEGMVVHTYGGKVEEGRRAVMEFLLVNHPLDCPICDKGGECDLQDFSMAYGQSASRLADPKSKKPKAIDLGPTIVLDDERCIVCQRCSRFDELITHERSLVVKDRGQRDVIATASGEPYRSDFSGNVTELCPVGALTSKTYRFKSRPWDNERTETTCFACSVGCKQNVDVRHGAIARTMSVENDDAVSDGWLCDRGRYNIGYVDDARRVTTPLLRVGSEFTQISWDDAIELVASKLRAAIDSNDARSIGVLGGSGMTNEEIVLLAELCDGLGISNRDWRTGRQSQASPGPRGGSYADLENAQLIVAIGRPPSQTAPVMDLRIRKAVKHGATYVVVGDHAPGSFVPAHHVSHIADVAPHLTNPVTGAGVERIAFVWDGISGPDGTAANELMDALAAKGATIHTFVPGEFANARGAEALGLLPTGDGLGSDAMLAAATAGEIRVLALVGADPVLTHPAGASAAADALERADFVVAFDLFLTQSSSLANLVLPICASLEKEGHAYDLTGGVSELRAAQVAPEGVLAEGDILVALAAELGVAISAPAELLTRATASLADTHAFADAALARGSSGTASAPAADLRLAVASSVFAGGGSSYFDERFAPLRPIPSVVVHPQTAGATLEAGAIVDLVAGDRRVRDLVVALRDDAAPGVAVVYDGLPQAPANALRAGETVRFDNVRVPQRELAGGVA